MSACGAASAPRWGARLQIDVLDASGTVISRAYGSTAGDIPGGGDEYFSVPLPVTGASYRVTVVSFSPAPKGGD